MSTQVTREIGSAVMWKGVQLFSAKAISLLRFVVLARLLTPDDFGLLAIAAVGVEMLMAVTNLGLSKVLVQRETIERELFDTAWTVGILRAALVALALAIGAPHFAELFGEPRAENILRVLAFKPLLDATASIKMVDLTRRLRFQSIAVVKISSAAVDTIGSIILVLVLPPLLIDVTVSVALVKSYGVWALVIGAFAGSLVSVVLSYMLAPYRPHLHLEKGAVQGLLRFGGWLFATSLVGMIGHTVLRGIISIRLGVAELGLFYLGLKLTALPNDLAGDAIRSVAFPVVSRVQAEPQKVRRAFQGSLTAMFVVLVPVYVLMIVLSPSLCRYVLGPQWIGLVPVIQLLSLDGVIDVVSDAAKPILLGLGQPHKRFFLKGIRTLFVILFAWALITRIGVIGAALAWVAAETAQSLAAITMVRKVVTRPFAGIGVVLSAIVTAAVAGGGIAWMIDALYPGITGLIIGAGLGLITAACTLWILDRIFALDLTSDFVSAFPAVATRLSMLSESK